MLPPVAQTGTSEGTSRVAMYCLPFWDVSPGFPTPPCASPVLEDGRPELRAEEDLRAMISATRIAALF